MCPVEWDPRVTPFLGGAWLHSPGPWFTWESPAGARRWAGGGSNGCPCSGDGAALTPHLAEPGAPQPASRAHERLGEAPVRRPHQFMG